MIRMIDLESMKDVLELLELQQLAYRVEATLIGFEEIPPLLDSPSTLRESNEAFLGYYLQTAEGGERLAGAIACKQTAKELQICRLMVHPDCFRRGIAAQLLTYVEQHTVPGMRIKVSTGTGNTPAVELYVKHGYEPVGMQLVAPGITLTQFQKIV
ncbi:GNAT family N-acetyltransferase [Paenibacillus cremeus]|uniref:GNAT family N-acetyltransferase n=1 Tax=Paenibacillus cremeus TaxID=2163881 RepID=A0A559JME5_9BACL|nr:GNAT family N-acetyltransferase [Paenibacillus cremeus]TVY01055.1 GNAT family N-acetyltransferase [Paenibacillus cremeus]